MDIFLPFCLLFNIRPRCLSKLVLVEVVVVVVVVVVAVVVGVVVVMMMIAFTLR